MLAIGIICLAALPCWAAKVDTVYVKSPAMQKTVPCTVIVPDRYRSEKTRRFRTLYLLHGYGGDHTDWVKKAPVVMELADRFQLLVVCPNGSKNSWYLDSPVNPAVRYETFFAKTLVPYIDKRFRTVAHPKGRGITGLSMGGHGALFLAFRHQSLFGAAGSMSGGVDLQPFPNNWELPAVLGEYAKNQSQWDQHAIVGMLHWVAGTDMPIMVDCGVGDFFLPANRLLHERMLYYNIPHDYVERPGAHDWDYWQNAIPYQAMFFDRVLASE